MKIYDNGVYRDMTLEEIQQANEFSQKMRAEEAHRFLTESEVSRLFTNFDVNTLSVDDSTALKMKSYYPDFSELIGQTIKDKSFKFTYNGDLYKTKKPDLLIQEQYPPSINTAALYEIIPEQYLGNKYDPIPYGGNMALEKDKFYIQYDVMYLCIESTADAVYADLKDLPRYVKVTDKPKQSIF